MRKYDLTELWDVASNDKDFMVMIAQQFITDVGRSLDVMNLAFADRNFAEIQQQAHKIKPTLISFKIPALLPVVEQIEHSANGRNESQLSPLLAQLSLGLHSIFAQLAVEFDLS